MTTGLPGSVEFHSLLVKGQEAWILCEEGTEKENVVKFVTESSTADLLCVFAFFAFFRESVFLQKQFPCNTHTHTPCLSHEWLCHVSLSFPAFAAAHLRSAFLSVTTRWQDYKCFLCVCLCSFPPLTCHYCPQISEYAKRKNWTQWTQEKVDRGECDW